MKSQLILFANILLFLMGTQMASAYDLGYPSHRPVVKKTSYQNSITYTCKYSSADVGTIVGVGPSRHAAHADAAEKCFDRQVILYEKIRGQAPSMERGQAFIDSCINITCG